MARQVNACCTPRQEKAPVVVAARNGSATLRYGDAYIHSAYDPEREARTWADSIVAERDDAADTFWVVFGAGLGYHLKALRERGARDFLVYEPDRQVFELASKTNGSPAGNDRQTCTSIEDLRDRFRSSYPQAKHTRLVALPSYARIFSSEYSDIQDRIHAYARELRADAFTYVSAGAKWLLLTIDNMPLMMSQPSIVPLRKLAGGWPAVVVSPGPSLEKNIDQLAEQQDHFLVICPSQTLRALWQAGIRPDLVVVADSQRLDYHFDDIPLEFYSNLVLAAKCHPRVCALPAARRFFYHLNSNALAREFFSFRGEEGCEVVSGHSVSNICFSLGVFMDADPIVLMGQDLAFTDKRMYCNQAVDGGQALEFSADGSQVSMRRFSSKLGLVAEGEREDFRSRLALPQQVVRVHGQDGQMLPSSTGLRAMLTWFERQAESLNRQHRLINSTEGGAFIRGMEHLAFSEVVAELQTGSQTAQRISLESRIDRLPQISPADKRSMLAGMKRMMSRLDKLGRLARRCDSLTRQCLGRGQPAVRMLAELQKAEQKLAKGLAGFPSIDALTQDAMREHRSLGDPGEDNLAANLERSRILYMSVAKASKTLKQALAKAHEKGRTI